MDLVVSLIKSSLDNIVVITALLISSFAIRQAVIFAGQNWIKTFAHTQFVDDKYSNPDVIKKKISEKIDLFERGHSYEKKNKNEIFPNYLLKEINNYEEFLI